MKRVIVLLAAILLLACESKDLSLSESTTGSSLSRSANEAVEVVDQATSVKFSVSITKIEDSRCPSDVVCIQGGWAEVTFVVNQTNTHLRINESYEFSVDGEEFKLTLTDVTPYPSQANAGGKKKAYFVVTSI